MKVRFSNRFFSPVFAFVRKGKMKAMTQRQPWTRSGVVPALAVLGLTGLVVCSVVGITFPGTALATPSSGFASTVFGPTLFDEIDLKTHTDGHKVMIKTWGSSDVYVVTNVVAPGGQSGWHTHPGPSLVSVKSGTATYYEGDDPTCTPRVVRAGEGFVDQEAATFTW